MLSDKIILITGGSGTIGSALVEHILMNYSPKIIRIYSRDETKQYLLKNKLKKFEDKLRFFIGDIRDKERVIRAMDNVDIVFHLAALKHVGACEYNPFEAIKTNVIGLQNLIEAAIEKNIEKFVYTSTDKAATPSNTMGVTKLLGEKLITSANYYKGATCTIFYSVRFGNVLGSRGSLIPVIKSQVKNGLSITITHSDMSRYIMSTNNAIKLILRTLKLAQGGEIFVLKMEVLKIIDLIEILIENFAELYEKKADKIQIEEVGMFEGEKLYEELFSVEESGRTFELEDMYIILPHLKLVANKINLDLYPSLNKLDGIKTLNSRDSEPLSKKSIKEYLKSINLI